VSALVTLAPNMPLDELRSGGRSRPVVNVRRQVIARALNAGFRPHQIARFLNISPTTVSLASGSR
jgi:DNA-binding NarL/FixJ family response regulator